MPGVSIASGVTATDTNYSTSPPSSVATTGSPLIVTNNRTTAVNIIVSGGTVTTIEFSRDGSTYYLVGLLSGMFLLNPGDRLRVSYLVAPTITQVPV